VVVTALKELPRGRVEVQLDGAAWRVLPSDAVVRAGLRVGHTLDRPAARTLARELRRTGALRRAARALATRDRSRRALDERLERAGVTAAARADALAALERSGVIDDGRTARSRADGLASRGYGDAAIRETLEREGIPADIATASVAELEPERERARRLLGRAGGPRELRRLAARGFEPDLLADLARFADSP
jgi:SOS response regulatory protein OraA/RecX